MTNSYLIEISDKIIEDNFSDVFEPAGGKGYRVLHARRVGNYIREFIDKNDEFTSSSDKDVIIAAGILHDIGDLAKIKNKTIDYSIKLDHSIAGAEKIQEELLKHKIDINKINLISEIVRNHHNYNKKHTNEIKLVQDADQIDELGLINVWQMFLFSANTERSFEKTLDYWKDEGLKRKKECVKNMNFDFSKIFARKRYELMIDFFQELEKENGMKDIA